MKLSESTENLNKWFNQKELEEENMDKKSYEENLRRVQEEHLRNIRFQNISLLFKNGRQVLSRPFIIPVAVRFNQRRLNKGVPAPRIIFYGPD